MKIGMYHAEFSPGDVVRFREDVVIVHGVIFDLATNVPSYWIHDFNGRVVPGTVQGNSLVLVRSALVTENWRE